jgi:opacity protein-like surface antigen
MKFCLVLFSLVGSLSAFSGLHVGGNVGVAGDFASFEAATFVPEGGEPFVGQGLKSEGCKRRLAGELYLGYGCEVGCGFYLGGRLGINFASSQVASTAKRLTPRSVETFENAVALETNSVEPTLDVRPGYILCDDTMLYGLIGIAYSWVELQGRGDLLFTQEILGSTGIQRTGSNGVGARFGLGLERLFCGCYGINLSYVYTLYPKQHLKADTVFNTGSADLDLALRVRARPSKQMALIGLSYYF